MKKSKIKAIYIAIWAVLLIVAITISLLNFGYEDNKDYIVAIMTIALPFGMMLLDMFNYSRLDNYPTAGKFIASNFLLVFVTAFIAECFVVIFGFGIKNPQYKLFYTFALCGAGVTAMFNLFQTGFYVLIAGKSSEKSSNKKSKKKK